MCKMLIKQNSVYRQITIDRNKKENIILDIWWKFIYIYVKLKGNN